MSKSTSSKTVVTTVLATFLFALAGCGGESTPASVAPQVTNTAQPPVEQVVEPTAIAAERESGAEETQRRIVLAQTDPAPASGRFQLGTHYQRLPAAQGTSSSPDQIEVAEVFWYGCPHCYTFDPYIENWLEDLPEDVSFVRIPAVWNALLQVHARAFYAAQALNVDNDVHAAFFREIHISRNGLDNLGALAEFFSRHGIDADDFNSAYESFAVNTRMNRADELARRYRIGSVPTVVINGKYTTDAGMAGSYEDLMELIDELVAMERAGE